MESIETEVTTIVYIDDGWYIWDVRALVMLQGPYKTHDEVREAIETRAWRISQGWNP